ncbi:MAG: Na/Pi symporter [Planctomycetes bacterium]|nr:Na/Pi symporter [Planctomycetota bacterium]
MDSGAPQNSGTPPAAALPGVLHRWTQILKRRPEWRQNLWLALQAALLIYAFLAAINMMGKGIKTIAQNPQYVHEFPGDPAFDRCKKDPQQAMRIVTTPAEAGGRGLVGRMAGTIGVVGDQGGYVAIGQRAVRAVCVAGVALHHSCVRIVDVRDDIVVVEAVPEHKDWLYRIFSYAENPFVALMVGILVTAVFQSSSFTTSFAVGMIATINGFDLKLAIPLVMGANIGTSVTCILVSLGYIRRRDEFRRAFAGATVHDFFKILTVLVLFPIEISSHILQRMAEYLAGLVYHGGRASFGEEPTNWITVAVSPLIAVVKWLLADLCGLGETAAGTTMTVIAVALLFASLLLLVNVLKKLVLRRAESFFDRVLFRNAPAAFIVGLLLTASVQSSSVTSSLVVPLIAAGLLTLNQVFPYLMGANIGTTVTALIAAFATSAASEEGAKLGLTLACVHLLFNVIGAMIFYPLRWIPIAMAKGLANRAAESRRYAVAFVLGVFFGGPLLGILLHWLYVRLVGG